MAWQQIRTFIVDPNDPQKRRIIVNPAKQFVQPFELPTDRPNQRITVAALGRAGPIPLTARFDGPIEIFYVKVFVTDTNNVALTDYNIRWLLEHPGKRKQFMSRPLPLIATAGDGGRPYVLPESIFLPAVQSLNVTFFNDDGAVRIVELVLAGIKFYPNSSSQRIRKEMFGYIDRREKTYTYFLTTDRDVVLTALQTDLAAEATIPDDADLEIFKLSAESTGTFRARIRDGTNDRGLTGNKIHSSLLFGGHIVTAIGGGVGGSGGVFPSRWPTTFLARRSTQLNFDFDDLSNSGNTVRPVFAGRKVRYA